MNKTEPRGLTLVEVAITLAMAAFVLGAVAAYSIPFLQREQLRSATYDIRTLMQVAKVESVARNHPCRFVFDTATSAAEVWDGMGTTLTADDQLLTRRELSDSIVVARPDAGSPITLEQIDGGSSYQTVFAADGVVAKGAGAIFLYGTSGYRSITVFGAGGLQVQQWNGSAWISEYASHGG